MRRERDTQSFYADCFYIVSSQPNQRAAPVAYKVVWPSPSSESQPSSSETETQLTAFSQISARCVTSPKYPGPIPIWDFYFNISEWHILSARAWTPALMLHLTNPCARRKVLSLTIPKGKIYKTKSLGNYITLLINHKLFLHCYTTRVWIVFLTHSYNVNDELQYSDMTNIQKEPSVVDGVWDSHNFYRFLFVSGCFIFGGLLCWDFTRWE